MTRERRLAVQMWREIAEDIRGNDRRIINVLKSKFCGESTSDIQVVSVENEDGDTVIVLG